MLSKFNNEVLSKGPAAVLPQNLDRVWLKRIQQIAEDFLDQNFSLDECKDPQDVADPLLSVCVYEILRHQQVDPHKVPTEKMIENMAIYAISIVMEAVDRESKIGLYPPGLDNILSIKRLIGYRSMNPDLIDLLQQACVIRNSNKGWFDHIKEKILEKVSGD